MDAAVEELGAEELIAPWEAVGLSEAEFAAAISQTRGELSEGRDSEFLSSVVLQTSDARVTPNQAAALVGWILVGQDPQEWLAQEAAQHSTSTCGHVFKDDEFLYKCFVCATDPTCVMCAECWEHSPCRENGHQFQFFRAQGGGCCDCGDHEAWNPQGFCSRHRGMQVEDDGEAEAPEDIKGHGQRLLREVVDYICMALSKKGNSLKPQEKGEHITLLHNDSIHDMYEVQKAIQKAKPGCSEEAAREIMMTAHNTGYAEVCTGEYAECNKAFKEMEKVGLIVNITQRGWFLHEKRATRLLEWLTNLGKTSNWLRKLVSDAMLERLSSNFNIRSLLSGEDMEDSDHEICNLDLLMRKETTFWPGCYMPLHDLYIQLIGEERFKQKFAERFVAGYSELIDKMAKSRTEGDISLLDLSVQVFTVPSVVKWLVKERNLLKHLFSSLVLFFKEASDRLLKDADQLLRSIFLRLCHDIIYVLRIPGVVKELLSSEEAFGFWLELCEHMQGMDTHSRAIHQHVEYDSRSWSYAFALVLDVVPIHNQILSGLREIAASQMEGDGTEVSDSAAFKSLGHAGKKLLFWYHYQGNKDKLVCEGGWVNYDVSVRPISFHIPLHRFFVSCWIECLKHQSNPDIPGQVQGLLLNNPEFDMVEKWKEAGFSSAADHFGMMLLEYPLRILTVLAQHQANMWARNGLAIPGQQYAYCGPSLCEAMHQLDLLALQLSVCIVGPDRFLTCLEKRFGIEAWLTEGQAVSNQEDIVVLVGELLSLLVIVKCERGLIRKSTLEDDVRRSITHHLFTGAKTHSTLMRIMSPRMTEADCFDDILQEVAEFRKPDATQQGEFKIKSDAMEQVDPFWFQFTRKDRELVREKWRLRPNPDLPVFSELPSFLKGISDLLFSRKLWSLLATVIKFAHQHGAGDSSSRFVNDTVLHAVLYCLGLAIRAADQQGTDGRLWDKIAELASDESLVTNQQTGETLTSGLAKLVVQAKLPVRQGCRFQHNLHLQDLQMLISALSRGSSVCRGIIEEIAKPEDSSAKDSDDGKAARARKQKEARERAMAQMAAQQKAFASMLGSDDEDEDLEEMEVSAATAPEEGFAKELEEAVKAEGQQCVLCHEEASQDKPLGLVAFVQSSTLLGIMAQRCCPVAAESSSCTMCEGHDALTTSSELGWEGAAAGRSTGLAVTFCGHSMHADCLHRYKNSLNDRYQDRGHGAFVEEGEFPCPLCRGLGNTLVPIIAKAQETTETSVTAVQSVVFGNTDSEDAAKAGGLMTEEVSVGSVLQHASTLSESEDPMDQIESFLSPEAAGQAAQKFEKENSMVRDMQDKVLSIHELCQSARKIEDNSFSNPISSACSAVVYSLFCMEASSRSQQSQLQPSPMENVAGGSSDFASGKALHEIPVSELARVMVLIRAIQRMLQVQDPESGWRWAHLTRWARLLRGQGRSAGGVERSPWVKGLVDSLVEADMASILAHWLLLLCKGLKNEFDGILLILWLAQLVQGILCFAKDIKANSFSKASGAAGMASDEDSSQKRMRIDDDDDAGRARFVSLVEKVLKGVGIDNINFSSLDIDLLLDKVLLQCIPFLRRAALLKTVLLGSSLPPESASGIDKGSAQCLLKHLHLPGPIGVPAVDGAMGLLIQKWCSQIHDKELTQSEVLDKAAQRRWTAITPPTLHPLPRQFHDLLRDVLKKKSNKSGTVPLEPAICLLCGDLQCAGSTQDANMIGECTQHTVTCGAGCAPFLMVKQCLVLIMRPAFGQSNSTGCRYNAPYLDSYGEEDPGLKRGRPLELSADRYLRLQHLWATHKLRAEVARASHRGLPMAWENI